MPNEHRVDELERRIAEIESNLPRFVQLERNQIDLEHQVVASDRDLSEMKQELRTLRENATSVQESIPSRIKDETASYVRTKIAKYTTILSSSIALAIVAIAASMWASPPFRLSVMELLNIPFRMDELIAYKLSGDSDISAAHSNPLGHAISQHVANDLKAGRIDLASPLVRMRNTPEFLLFNEQFDNPILSKFSYTLNDTLKEIVALSFPISETIPYSLSKVTIRSSLFYSAKDDQAWLFCLFYSNDKLPSLVEFAINNEYQENLRFEPSDKTTDIHKRPLAITRGSKYGSGIHELTMRITPPDPPQEQEYLKAFREATATAKCIIAVVGRSSANELIN